MNDDIEPPTPEAKNRAEAQSRPTTVRSYEATKKTAMAFLAGATASDPYLSNAIERLFWWSRDRFRGQP